MGGACRGRAITAVGPYAAGALAVGTSMMTHATPFDTAVLLAEGAAISLLCGAVRTSRERERAHALGEAEARRCEAAARAAEAEARQVAEEARSSAEDAVRRAGADFESAQTFRESQEVGRLKDEFLATVSHELRTPLNAILGWTTMLRRKPDVDTRKALDTIERNARVPDAPGRGRPRCLARGHRQAEDRADRDRPGRRGRGRRWTSVAPTAEGRGVALDVRLDEVPCVCRGDADRLRRAFWNLLSNAIKFTARGGRVARSPDANRLARRVRRGRHRPGHPPRLPSSCLRSIPAGRQLDDARRGGPRAGARDLKHIVELHGGTVSAQSRGEGYGATFTIALPVQALQAAPPSAPGRPPKLSSGVYLSSGGTETAQGLAGIRVLVCDDDEECARSWPRCWRRRAPATRDAAGGCAALEAFREFAPHVFASESAARTPAGTSSSRRSRDARGGGRPDAGHRAGAPTWAGGTS